MSRPSARSLPLPTAHPTSSLLYDPPSSTLALRHPDSSFSLYPSFTPLSPLPTPSPTPLPAPTSSAAFLRLHSTTVFLTSSPILHPPSTLLRFYLLRPGNRFVKSRAVSSHRDLVFDRFKFGVVFGAGHGVKVALSGGVNFFAMHSVSSAKIWVFGVRLVGDGGEEVLKLMKCAAIDCCLPLFAVRVLSGFLVVGEENGVRVFPIQLLVRGRKEKKKNGGGRIYKNGLTNGIDVAKTGNGGKTDGDFSVLTAKSEKREKNSDSVKSRFLKLRQDSKDVGAFFVSFEDKGVESSVSTKTTRSSVKAISIEALSGKHFVVLDSIGDVHILCLSHPVQGLGNQMKRITQTMKVLKMAVFHDVSTVTQMQTQTIWISDGSYSAHMMVVSDMNTSFDKVEKKDKKDTLVQTSVTQAIFSSEKIQDIVPLAANAVLILGQGVYKTAFLTSKKYVCLRNFMNLLDISVLKLARCCSGTGRTVYATEIGSCTKSLLEKEFHEEYGFDRCWSIVESDWQ